MGGRSWVAGTPAGGPGRTPPPRRWPPGAAPGGPRRQQALALLTPNGSQSPPAPILTVGSWTTAATPSSFVGAREVRGHETGTLAALRRSQLNVTLREGDTRGAKGHGRRGRAVSSGLCKEVPVQPRFEIRRICSKRPGAKAGRVCQAEGAAGAGPRGGEECGRREPPASRACECGEQGGHGRGPRSGARRRRASEAQGRRRGSAIIASRKEGQGRRRVNDVCSRSRCFRVGTMLGGPRRQADAREESGLGVRAGGGDGGLGSGETRDRGGGLAGRVERPASGLMGSLVVGSGGSGKGRGPSEPSGLPTTLLRVSSLAQGLPQPGSPTGVPTPAPPSPSGLCSGPTFPVGLCLLSSFTAAPPHPHTASPLPRRSDGPLGVHRHPQDINH